MAGHTARTLRPQDEISHYRIVAPLGAGGMGEVYLAQDQTLERNVALKILPPDLVRSEERVRRFVLEAKSASSLSHPNIVTIYEIGQDAVRSPGEPESGAVHFISMELVSGKTFSTLVHEDRTDLRTLLGYLAQAADGLAKAHAAGIVHRDLKPGNIMVTADGFAKVLDFGLAKLTEKRSAGPDVSTAPTVTPGEATEEGVVVGTTGYMSPEQVQGKTVDARSDIFSFGCVLYEAATRQRPFAAESGFETMHRIIHDTPTPVEQLNPKVPAELRRLIRRCLAKNPEQRLQSMKDLAIELREIADEYDTLSASASSGSLASGVAPAAPRRNAAPLWIGAGLVLLAGAALAWWGMRRGAAPTGPPQNMRTTNQTSRGDVIDCALSPDGRFLAYLAGAAGRLSLRVRQVATGSDVEVLPASDNTLLFPSFSQDGNYLYYCAATPEKRNYRALYQVPSLGGTPRRCGFDVDSRVSPSPDGSRIAFWRFMTAGVESRLVVLDPTSGAERVLATSNTGERYAGAPSWSPDGKRIAGILFRPAPDLHSTISIFDVASGRRRDLVTIPFMQSASVAWLRDGTGLVSSGFSIHGTSTQVYLHTYPGGRTSRVTNDFNWYGNLTAARTSETLAAVRTLEIDNVWVADAEGGAARRLTSVVSPENSTFQATPLDSGTVVYCAPADQFVQVWAVALAGGEPRQLTSGNANFIEPFAGGGRLYYSRADSSGMQVWSAGADGSNPRQLTTGVGGQIQELSPDGRALVSSHYENLEKFSVLSAVDGHSLLELNDITVGVGFSPDSRSILIGHPDKDARGLSVNRWQIVPLAGGAPSPPFQLPDAATGIHWAPDGRSVTFRDRADPEWNVFRQPIAGGAPQAVTHFTRGRVTEHQWSPDGTRLAVSVDDGPGTNMWILSADGTRPVQVTQFATEHIWRFRWMPDSRHVVVDAGTSSSDAVLIHDFR